MKTKILIKFGTNVRDWRQKLKLSQERLAEITGLHRTYIGGIERGERNITLLNIIKLAKGLKCDIVDLLRGLD